MKCHVLCPSCKRVFGYETESTPAQRGWSKRSARYGQILAYYPVCPHCSQSVEVSASNLLPPKKYLAK